MNKYELPEQGLVRLPVVLACVPVSKSTWWAGVKSGRYPKAIKLGKNITAWNAEDIRRLIETGDMSSNHHAKSE